MGVHVWSRFSLVPYKWCWCSKHFRTWEVSLLLRYKDQEDPMIFERSREVQSPQKFKPLLLRTGSRYRHHSNGVNHSSSSRKRWRNKFPAGGATSTFVENRQKFKSTFLKIDGWNFHENFTVSRAPTLRITSEATHLSGSAKILRSKNVNFRLGDMTPKWCICAPNGQNSRMTSISDEKWHGFQLNYKV